MSYIFQKGSTDVSVEVYIVDSGDGTPETGVVFNTSGIDLFFRRDGAAVVAITEADLATPALTDAHLDGGFLHIFNGLYRLDLPDAACATGVDKVVVGGTVTGMVVLPVTIQLVDYDPNDAVRLGLTALPGSGTVVAAGPTKAEMDTAHGLLATPAQVNTQADLALTDYNGPTSAELVTEINSVQTDIAALNDPTVGAIADQVWNEAQADHVAGGSFGVTASEIAAITAAGPTKTEMDTGHGLLATEAKQDVIDGIVDLIKIEVDKWDTAQGEPGQATPAVNETPLQKLAFLFKAWRNKKDSNGSTTQLYNDDGTTVAQKQATSESAGTVTKDEWVTGP